MANPTASEMGKKGGSARALILSQKRRREIARMGGLAKSKKRQAAKWKSKTA